MLTVTVEFLRTVFEGADPDDPAAPEWPPSWMRVFSAFVDAAAHDTVPRDKALRYLESLGVPRIGVPEAQPSVRAAYVPTNDSNRKHRSSTLLHRTNSERRWPRMVLREPVVTYTWPDADFPSSAAADLRRVARRIAYVGRSTSPAIVEVATEAPPATFDSVVPAITTGVTRELSIRVPFPGALEALRTVHTARLRGDGGDPWAVGVRVDYGTETPEPVEAAPSAYRTMVVLRIVKRYLDGRNAAAVARYTRGALMSRLGTPALPELHGHDPTVDRVAVVPLPDVGGDHSDGHLLGVALCIPRTMPADAYGRLVAALPGPDGEPLVVNAGRLGRITLERIPPAQAITMPWGLRMPRWARASARWVTATPLVTDRFLKYGDPVAEEVARLVERAGLPPLRRLLAWDRHPLLPGAPDLRPEDTLRRRGDRARRPYFHAELELEQEVEGPVILGSMRNYGLGLCVPSPTATEEAADG